MTMYEFNLLSNNEKADMLWQRGIHLDSVGCKNVIFGLYAIADFFVEIELINYDIHTIRPFKNSSRLDKYLDKIDLSVLLNEKDAY